MKEKVAVLLAGPSRYINSTIESIYRVYDKNSVDLYIYLWKSDKGSKVRESEEVFPLENISENNIRFFALAEPEAPNNYDKIFKSKTESGQSVASSIVGMFNSMRILVNQVEMSTVDYKIVIRLRTDCAISSSNFLDLKRISDNEVYCSKNYLIPHKWVSDHIMAGSKTAMLKVWGWKNTRELYKGYVKCDMNPEKLLAYRLKKVGIKPVEKWIRYDDYHIVYNPVKNGDPEAYNTYLKEHSVDTLFRNICDVKLENYIHIKSLIQDQKKNQDYYAKNIFYKAYFRLLNIIRSCS